MKLANGKTGEAQEFSGEDGMAGNGIASGNEPGFSLNRWWNCPDGIAGESGKNGKKMVPDKMGTERVSSAKPERPCLESLHFRSKEM